MPLPASRPCYISGADQAARAGVDQVRTRAAADRAGGIPYILLIRR
jgi:hypothetical protein